MKPSIIAHRGASAYLPEHTLPAKAMAYAMGADYLEQDLVASRDDHLVVLHDVHLDRVTDVARRYPDRHRADGRYYVRDFDLAEIRELAVTERLDEHGGAVYPGRFPPHTGRFGIHTLAEELELVRGLNAATGRRVGVYPELKRPAWHRDQGVDMAPLLLGILSTHGYESAADPVFVQCFDRAEIERLREALGTRLKLVQLVGENNWRESDTDFDRLKTAAGLRDLARFADGIGPWIRQLYTLETIDGEPVSTGLVRAAQDAGLVVHPFTLRADDLPAGFTHHDALAEFLLETLGVDGVFTDFPDRLQYLIAAGPAGKR